MPNPRVFQGSRSNQTLWCILVVCLIAATASTSPIYGSSLRRSAIVEAVAAAGPSVVSIHGKKTLPNGFDQDGTPDSPHLVNGMGTGIIIDQRGYVLTNYHVVEGVRRIRVTMGDGTDEVATLVANDPKTDLAILQISSETPFPVIKMGTSSDLMPGETVVAVGNAYGYQNTVTKGIISALHRSVQVSEFQKYHDLIQTDASINPGNSGGPLLNIDGDMIGINVAVRVGAQGIGFSIPIDQAMEVAATLLATQKLSRLYHGVTLKTETGQGGSASRVVVDEVAKGSPAEKAGLEPGDVLVSLDGTSLSRRLDFERALLERAIGEELRLEILRTGQTKPISLVLSEGSRLKSPVADEAWSVLGLRLAPISSSAFRSYKSRYRGGLRVASVRPASPAAQQGIRRGDILVGLHKWETISMDNVAFILDSPEFRSTQPFKFYVLRNGETLYGHMHVAKRQ